MLKVPKKLKLHVLKDEVVSLFLIEEALLISSKIRRVSSPNF